MLCRESLLWQCDISKGGGKGFCLSEIGLEILLEFSIIADFTNAQIDTIYLHVHVIYTSHKMRINIARIVKILVRFVKIVNKYWLFRFVKIRQNLKRNCENIGQNWFVRFAKTWQMAAMMRRRRKFNQR